MNVGRCGFVSAVEAADNAQRGILEAAKYLGMDLGAEWGNELDLRPGANAKVSGDE